MSIKLLFVAAAVAILSPLLLLPESCGVAGAGVVVELDGAAIDALLQQQQQRGGEEGATLVEFYAPWCGNCKKVLPVLEELAAVSAAQDPRPVRVAKVDTTLHTEVGERYGITRFPTFKYFFGGRVVDYTGPRDVASMRSTARRLTSSAVARVNSAAEADAHVPHDVVHFRLLVASADLGLDQAQGASVDGAALINAFYKVAERVHPNASFLCVQDAGAKVPHVVKREHGRDFEVAFSVDAASSDNSIEESLFRFVQMNNHKYIATIDNNNFRLLGSWGKHVAVAVLNADSDDRHRELLQTFDEVATELRETIHSDLVLGVLNAERYGGFVKHFKASPPSLLVLNMPHETFHLFAAEERIFEDRAALARAIRDAASADDVHGSGLSMKKISLHLGGGGGAGGSRLERAWRKLEQHYPWSVGLCLAPIVLLALSIWGVQDPRRKKGQKQD